VSPEHKTIVKSTWSQVVPIADRASTLFYDRLFTLDLSLRPMFEDVDMKEQRKKLMQALASVVNGLDHLDSLIPVLENLGRSHRRYLVTDQHYETVGAALLWTLEQGLASTWTLAVESAWMAAYQAVAGIMRRAANDAASAA
jgi:hemoglobin-like flavoprotein